LGAANECCRPSWSRVSLLPGWEFNRLNHQFKQDRAAAASFRD
jgi:hypothetical protein